MQISNCSTNYNINNSNNNLKYSFLNSNLSKPKINTNYIKSNNQSIVYNKKQIRARTSKPSPLNIHNKLIKHSINNIPTVVLNINNNNNIISNNIKNIPKSEIKNKEINNLNKNIKALTYELKKLKSNNKQNEYIRVDDLLTIQIKSIDQKVDTSFSCKKNDIFVKIEEMLYDEYPDYKDLNTYFTVNGRIVKRFRNLEENGIKNKDKILLNIYD